MSTKTKAILASMAFWLATTDAVGRPLDANGVCPRGATLELATGALAVRPDLLLQQEPFARAHRAHVQGEPAWLAELNGASGRNRLYRAGQQRVLVLTVCDPSRCDKARAYVGFDLSAQQWGASLYLDRQVRELGHPIMAGSETQVVPDEVGPALVCAQNLDWGSGR